jgi:hypothetical protein
MALDMTTFAAALKQHYVDFTVKNLVYKNNPALAMIGKDEKFGGLNMPLPLIYGNPQGRSATFSNALAQKTNSQIKAFTLTRASDYSLANIQNEVLEASQGDSDAFMRAATTEIDGAIQAATRSLAGAMYRNGTGSIGQISSGSNVNSLTLTLANIEDIVNFEVGMTIAASATDGGANRSGTAVITAVNRSLGTITTSGSNWSAQISSLTVGDYLMVAGDLNAKIKGFDAWIPMPGALTNSPFFGVDRTIDATRLAGINADYSGVPIEESLIDLAAKIGREGGVPDKCFMSFGNYANLEKALGSKVIYQSVKDPDGVVGFEGIKIHGPKGPITVIPDLNCQSDRFYMLQFDTWKLYSLGMAPKLLKSDGMEFLRVSSADAVEVRVGYYAQLGCVAPGWNGVGKLS